MTPLNYNHLYYFYTVSREGSIAKASASLHLTPQTISGQISRFEAQIGVNLFDRKGKTLQLSEMGRSIYSHAEKIFQLGDELSDILKNQRPVSWQTLSVGITDVIPKVVTHHLLKPALKMDESVRLTCHEGDQLNLLSLLAINKLDLIITDQPLKPGGHIKAYTHQIAESGLTFFATQEMAGQYRQGFPQSLSGQSFLMQSKKSAVRQRLMMWLDKVGVIPNIVAEFDDSALMKSFGQEGYGVFSAPTIIEKYIASQYGVEVIGRAEECIDRYYIISPERKIKHPAVVEIVNSNSQ
jgi:LysR family transcriptional activator of nhaA